MSADDPQPSAGRPRRLRMSGEERRAAILTAAVAVFGRAGFHGTTTAQIAQEAGCSEPTLFKYFPDKRSLLFACLQRTEERVEALIEEKINGPRPVRDWMEFVRTSPDYREMLLLRMLSSTPDADEELRMHIADAFARLRGRFQRVIEQGRRQGFITRDVDPEFLGWGWIGFSMLAIEGLLLIGESEYRRVIEAGLRFVLAETGARLPDDA